MVALENFEEMKATFLVQIVEVMTEFERKDMMGKFFDIIECGHPPHWLLVRGLMTPLSQC